MILSRVVTDRGVLITNNSVLIIFYGTRSIKLFQHEEISTIEISRIF